MEDMRAIIPAWLKLLVGFLLAGLNELLGGWDVPLQLLLGACIADEMTGPLAAIQKGGWAAFKPGIFAWGVTKKLLYFVAIILANFVDIAFAYKGVDTHGMFGELATWSYFFAELVSVCRNLKVLGIPTDVVLFGVDQLRGFVSGMAKSLVAQLGNRTGSDESGGDPLSPTGGQGQLG